MHDFYGDEVRWFIGKVVNTSDPDERNRVQVRIYGIHSEDLTDIPDYALPWAETLLPVTEGGVSGIGAIAQLQPSAQVFGIFLDGKMSQYPLVLGSLTQYAGPSVVQQTTQGLVGRGSYISPEHLGSDGVRVSPELMSSYDNSSSDVASKRLIATKFFVENGYTPIVAASIAGNLQAESNFNTKAVGDVNRGGSYGIAQWNAAAGRYQKLVSFANRMQQNPDDFFLQLKFIVHELRGKAVNNDGGSSYANVEMKLRSCTAFEGFNNGIVDNNATWIFCRYYENPASPQTKVGQREQYARFAYEQYTDSITTASAVVPGDGRR